MGRVGVECWELICIRRLTVPGSAAAHGGTQARRAGQCDWIEGRHGTDGTAGSCHHVSKAAMHSLVRVIGEEVRGTGVTANTSLPSADRYGRESGGDAGRGSHEVGEPWIDRAVDCVPVV